MAIWRRKRERDLEDEVRSHLNMAVQERIDRGASGDEAQRAARREFGNVGLVEETTRDAWGRRRFAEFVEDLRYGLRMLRKNPGFTLVAVLTLALGIGANTALFSVVNGVLLNPLPYPQPEQLVTLHASKPNFDAGSISFLNFRDWRKDNTTFSMMAVTRQYSYTLTGLGDSEQLQAQLISTDLLPMLGVKPAAGRFFAEGEDDFDRNPIALISAGFSERKFASAPVAVGKAITLDGRAYTIVGVVPASFRLRVGSFQPADVYVPMGQWSNPFLRKRSSPLGLHGIGRLKPGVSIEQARADMTRVTHSLAEAYPDVNKGIGATLFPMKDHIVGRVRLLLIILLSAVGFVLLIACVNVANLLIVRSAGRAREFAVRAALGAGRGRIVSQLLTESMLLALVGGGFGLLLAYWATTFAIQRLPEQLPRAAEIGMDWKVFAFTAAIALLCGVLFGLVPAFRVSRPDLRESLKEGGRGSVGPRQRLREVLVVAEMAMALVLLIAAGLMTRSLFSLWQVNPGFDARGVLSFGISLPPTMREANPDAIRATLRSVAAKIASTPGVKNASLSWGALPLAGDDEDLFWIEGQPRPQATNDMNWAISYVVQQDYLQLMGIPLLRGRFFASQDGERASHVIVVDDVFARKYFPDQDPIGKRIVLEAKGGVAEIVGVVGHVKQWGLDSDDTQKLRAELYFPYMQLPDAAMQLSAAGTGALVRFDGDGQGVASAIRRGLKAMNGDQVMYGVQTMEEIIADSLAARRLSMIVLGVFAALAVVLASIGIYGVISYLVGQRTQEIGIRMALGARPRDVLCQVLGQGAKMVALGVFIGLTAALGLTRLMATLLFGVSATDPLTFAAVAALLALVALAACYLPARRAMRVDPIVALRYE
jgi:putative ABC transport system permease protein